MNNFLRAYNITIIYVSGLTILGFIGYYSLDFPIAKASRIGTLYGFAVGVVLNIIPAFYIMLKLNKESQPSTIPQKSKKSQKPKKPQKASSTPTTKKAPLSSSIMKEMYLLLDKEMAFDVSLHSILDQSLGTLLNTNKHRGTFSVRTAHQVIDFEVYPLTRHTSKLNIKAQKQNDTFNNILSYIKNKESSILTY
jgi:hypothetical protein